jgi:hypothetical protein
MSLYSDDETAAAARLAEVQEELAGVRRENRAQEAEARLVREDGRYHAQAFLRARLGLVLIITAALGAVGVLVASRAHRAPRIEVQPPPGYEILLFQALSKKPRNDREASVQLELRILQSQIHEECENQDAFACLQSAEDLELHARDDGDRVLARQLYRYACDHGEPVACGR